MRPTDTWDGKQVFRIGILIFRADPFSGISKWRLRAMLSEAILQCAELQLLDCAASHEKGIYAHCWTGHDWVLLPVDPPDVTYIVGNPVKPEHMALIGRLTVNSRVVWNQDLSKLEQRDLFARYSSARYLIPTEKLNSEGFKDQIRAFLARHWDVGAVIKRSNGNQGQGILFAVPEGDAWKAIGQRVTRFPNIETISEWVAGKLLGRITYRDFLIQRFINSRAKDGRVMDVRVHVQRDRQGAWQVTRAYSRLGELGRLTTNLSVGGYQGPVALFLRTRSTRSQEELEAELMAAAIELAGIQSAAASRPLSELGLDFMLDDNDQIWLAETNALPQSAFHEQERAKLCVAYAVGLMHPTLK